MAPVPEMRTRTWNPIREFQDSIDRFYNEVAGLKNGREFTFSPSCEVNEDAKSYLFKFDLPGVPKENIKVELDKGVLTVQAERREEKEKKDKKTYLSEISYGTYARSFSMPGAVDESKIDAKFDHGVLTVTIPKSESSKGKQIQIQ